MGRAPGTSLSVYHADGGGARKLCPSERPLKLPGPQTLPGVAQRFTASRVSDRNRVLGPSRVGVCRGAGGAGRRSRREATGQAAGASGG